MAKPQRMAVMTAAAVLASIEPFIHNGKIVMNVALWIIIAGCIITAFQRSQKILIHLRKVVP
jgi:hypothetical protein